MTGPAGAGNAVDATDAGHAVDAVDAFRALHHADRPLLLANAWDYASAAALIDAGFSALGTTSLGVAAANGLPDGQGRTLDETLALTRRLAQLPCLLTVDIEGGFSDDPEEVARLARELAEAGAVGINIEDGRADGTLTPIDQQQELIRTVKARVPRLFLNARTDTHWLAGPAGASLPETLARVRAYEEAGADGVFVPGIADPDGIRAVVAAAGAPLNVIYLPGRHTLADLAALGVRRVSCGSLLFRAALRATVATVRAIAANEPIAAGIPSYAEITELISG
jgi:2-methylisocitrate lyase-like PEP mutase family enzyme